MRQKSLVLIFTAVSINVAKTKINLQSQGESVDFNWQTIPAQIFNSEVTC